LQQTCKYHFVQPRLAERLSQNKIKIQHLYNIVVVVFACFMPRTIALFKFVALWCRNISVIFLKF